MCRSLIIQEMISFFISKTILHRRFRVKNRQISQNIIYYKIDIKLMRRRMITSVIFREFVVGVNK